MDDKWIVILVIGFATAMFAPLGIIEYNKAQCRMEAIRAQMEPEAIVKVCGK